METQFDGAHISGDDEVARQRVKRQVAALNRLVPGFPSMTLGQVVASVMAAADEVEGGLDIEEFLAGEGHSSRTIEFVLAYLRQDVPMLPEPVREDSDGDHD
jgi:hypothetical protein